MTRNVRVMDEWQHTQPPRGGTVALWVAWRKKRRDNSRFEASLLPRPHAREASVLTTLGTCTHRARQRSTSTHLFVRAHVARSTRSSWRAAVARRAPQQEPS